MPDKKQPLVRFNIQNVKYAMLNNGVYGTPINYGTSRSIALEPNQSVKDIYGDGKRICSIIADKGKTGTLTTNNVSDDFEIAVGRKIKTKNGIADISQTKNPIFALYFEVSGINDDGTMPLAKTWLYGVTSPTRPSETFNQSEDDINESTFDTVLTIAGTNLKTANGEIYKDDKGNEIMVWQQTVMPNDEGYDTYGDAVVLPTMPANNEE